MEEEEVVVEVEEEEEEAAAAAAAAAEVKLWRCSQVKRAVMKFRSYHRDPIKIYFSTRCGY